jgi:TIGR03009 family protein
MTRLLIVLSLLTLVRPATALAQRIAEPAPGVPPGGVAPALGQPPIAPAIPQQPEWVARMTPQEQKWIGEVLHYWETRSENVKTFECRFRRWDYDGGFVDAKGERKARTYSEGEIKYAQPDKGLFHVQKLILQQPPLKPGEPPQAIEQSAELGEHWVCDGDKVFSFEASKKQVTVTSLPPDMRGKAIADGPLPFMFGAKAETINARYWIHEVPRAPGDTTNSNKYWLEAFPKSRQDAQNFKKVRIVLDKENFLPEILEVFAPNYDPPRNDARQTYVFSDRVAKDENSLKNAVIGLVDPLKLFHRNFFEPQTPPGWRKVLQNEVASVPAPPGAPQQAGPQQPIGPQQPVGPPSQRQLPTIPR